MMNPKIIVALDYHDSNSALNLTTQLDPKHCRLKIGKELFTQSGPAIVKRLMNDGFDIFLDLKYHDIPHTVAKACKVAADLGIWMLNVHALGGSTMMDAAREAVGQSADRTLLIAATILTSMDQTTSDQIGLQGSIEDMVLRLARLADDSGLDGVICSAKEATKLRIQHSNDFLLITPCIRLANSAKDDQHRIMTPTQAIKAGSNYLVIGRPITATRDPMATLSAIQQSLAEQ